MDRIDLLRIFLRIAATGSFSRAADQLALPRATVSIALQQLEARLGVRLLHRTTRRVSLTRDGEALLERAGDVVADMEDLEQRFLPAHGEVVGRLRIDVPSRIARRVIAPALPDFLAAHPRLDIDVGSSDRKIDLVEERVDCALRVGQLAPDSLVARPLGEFAMINCASPAYLAAHGTPLDPERLDGHLAVDYVPPSLGRAAPWEWQQGADVRITTLRSRVSANNVETYVACALAGLGMIQIPRFDVSEHLAAGDLVEVMPQAPPAPMPVNIVYPHRRHLSRRVHAFMGWMAALLRQHEAVSRVRD